MKEITLYEDGHGNRIGLQLDLQGQLWFRVKSAQGKHADLDLRSLAFKQETPQSIIDQALKEICINLGLCKETGDEQE